MPAVGPCQCERSCAVGDVGRERGLGAGLYRASLGHHAGVGRFDNGFARSHKRLAGHHVACRAPQAHGHGVGHVARAGGQSVGCGRCLAPCVERELRASVGGHLGWRGYRCRFGPYGDVYGGGDVGLHGDDGARVGRGCHCGVAFGHGRCGILRVVLVGPDGGLLCPWLAVDVGGHGLQRHGSEQVAAGGRFENHVGEECHAVGHSPCLAAKLLPSVGCGYVGPVVGKHLARSEGGVAPECYVLGGVGVVQSVCVALGVVLQYVVGHGHVGRHGGVYPQRCAHVGAGGQHGVVCHDDVLAGRAQLYSGARCVVALPLDFVVGNDYGRLGRSGELARVDGYCSSGRGQVEDVALDDHALGVCVA